MVNGTTEILYKIQFDDDNQVELRINGQTPWSRANWGPEGMAEYLGPLLPLHWSVFSVKSNVTAKYTLGNYDKSNIFESRGIAHMEKNWGSSFPQMWIWAQSFSDDHEIVLAGGDIGVASNLMPRIYLALIRTKNVELNWFPSDALLRPLRVKLDPKNGKLVAYGFQRGLMIVLNFNAMQDTFSKVQCPTVNGFVDDSIESYSANMQLEIRNMRSGVLIERVSVKQKAALEFGGSLMHILN